MTRSQIQCFLTVVEKMSITEAAKTLYVSQPAVSRRIAQLEEELGAKLFARDNTHLILTPQGRQAADIFREFENNIEDFIMDAKREKGASKLHGTVRIGVADGWDISRWFGDISAKVRERHADIKLTLTCCSHEELMHLLEHNEVDMVLDQRELFSGLPDITVHPLKKIKCILMFSKNHPLSGRKDLQLVDFKDSVFYVAVSKKAEKLILDMLQACIKAGFLPEIEHIGSLSATYIKMLSENGVFVADELLLAKDQPVFEHIELPIERTICLGCRNTGKAQCRAVEEIILESRLD